MAKEATVIVTVLVAIGILAFASGKFTLFSASAPTEGVYDFKYDYIPTVYDAGEGKGYQEVYPADLKIGEFSFPNFKVPLGNSQVNEFIKVQKLVG